MWRIQLLDTLCIQRDEITLHHFRTRKTGSLLAYLAFNAGRFHRRDAVIEMLWPDSDLEAGRNLLRVTLSSLRHHLEPPSVPKSSVLIADRSRIQLSAHLYQVDARDFVSLIEASRASNVPEEQAALLEQAAEMYKGPLLQEYDEIWILSERERLAETAYKALLRLVNLMLAEKRRERALEFATRAVSLEPAREEAHRVLMRLYGAMNRPERGLKQFQELETILHDTFQQAPSQAAREIFRQLQEQRERCVGQPQTSTPPVVSENASANPTPANLQSAAIPYRKTAFFGREQERAILCELLAPGCERLVTITGMAGCGKTRMALEIARDLTAAYHERVRFVDLSETTASDGILPRIIQALDKRCSRTHLEMEALVELLDGNLTLLALDNFEQLLEVKDHDQSASLPAARNAVSDVRAMLDLIPNLTLLITSRQRLDLTAEREFPLLPLPLPAPDLSPDKLMTFASARIFADRAAAANPAFRLGEKNAAAVASLCRELEGIPLAIELAAEWACTLTPAQMRRFLKRRFSLLVSRRTDQTQRHQALYSALEQSYVLLNDSLQRLFAGLSVFRGGWTLEAASSVFHEEPAQSEFTEGSDALMNPDDMAACIPLLTEITELLRRSMLYCIETDEVMRYNYLETLREFAASKLSVSDHGSLRTLHASHFADWAERLAPQITGALSEHILDQLDLEYDNLRAVFDWCVEVGQAEPGLRLIAALHLYWNARGRYNEAREQIGRIMALPEAQQPTRIRARAMQAAWMLARNSGDMSAVMAAMEEGLATLRALNDDQGVAGMLNNMGNAAICLGDLDRAEQLFFESLGIHRRGGNSVGMANPLNNLGEIAMRRGDVDSACRYFTESLRIFREAGNEEGIAGSLLNYGSALLLNGQTEEAEAALLESLDGWLRLRNSACFQEVLQQLIELAWLRQEWEQAAILIGQIERLQQEGEQVITSHSSENLAVRKTELRHRLAELRFEDCWSEGIRMSMDEIYRFVGSRTRHDAAEMLNHYAIVAGTR